MKIYKLEITNTSGETKEFNFEDKTLFHSKNNNRGKTLLMRTIMHALGVQITFPRDIDDNINPEDEIRTTKIQIIGNDGVRWNIKREKNEVSAWSEEHPNEYFDTSSSGIENSYKRHISELYKEIMNISKWPTKNNIPLSINYIADAIYKDQDYPILSGHTELYSSMYSRDAYDKFLTIAFMNNKIRNIMTDEAKTDGKNILSWKIKEISEMISSIDDESKNAGEFTEAEADLIKEYDRKIKLNRRKYYHLKKAQEIPASNTDGGELSWYLNNGIINKEQYENIVKKLKDKNIKMSIDKTKINQSLNLMYGELNSEFSSLQREKKKVIGERILPINLNNQELINSYKQKLMKYEEELNNINDNAINKRKTKSEYINLTKTMTNASLDNAVIKLKEMRGETNDGASNSGSDRYLKGILHYLDYMKKFDGKFPIMIDSIFMDEIDSTMKKKLIKLLESLDRQVILTSTVKEDDKSNHFDDFKNSNFSIKELVDKKLFH